ncbi:hypothetical protein EV421DRAFT_1681426, partial [Armillaria borealis]
PNLRYGMIMGVALVNFKDEEDVPIKGANRLYRILITESAWLMRNERGIGKEDNPNEWRSQQEIHNRWLSS